MYRGGHLCVYALPFITFTFTTIIIIIITGIIVQLLGMWSIVNIIRVNSDNYDKSLIVIIIVSSQCLQIIRILLIIKYFSTVINKKTVLIAVTKLIPLNKGPRSDYINRVCDGLNQSCAASCTSGHVATWLLDLGQ